jgi:hypothetical protein
MRESRTYGFVRGAHSNMRPYRDPYLRPTAITYKRKINFFTSSRRKWHSAMPNRSQ